MRRSLLVLLAFLVAPPVAGAQAGGVKPDPSFGTNGRGYVTLTLKNQETLAYGATTVSDGIVVAGQADPANGPGQVLVAKYTTDGTLDDDFAGDGIYTSSLPANDGPFGANAITQDKNGNLLLAGEYGEGSVLVMRLTPKGQLDRSFGTRGLTTISVGSFAQSLFLQSDGKILVGASNQNEQGRPMVVARLTANGAVDRSFGTNGLTEIAFWDLLHASSAGVADLATTANGSIVGATHLDYIGGDGHGSAGVFRLTADGKLDPTYGTGGGVEVAFTRPDGKFAQWFPCAMTLGPTGRATVVGDGTLADNKVFLTTRLTAAGAPDPSYGPAGDGRDVMPGASGGADTTCGAVRGPGSSVTLADGASFAQILQNGTPNRAFAPNGILNITRPAGLALNAVARAAGNRVVLAGSTGSNNLYVSRYVLPASG